MPERYHANTNNDYWSTKYKGSHIAGFYKNGYWVIYKDQRLVQDKLFITKSDAMNFLRSLVDAENQ